MVLQLKSGKVDQIEKAKVQIKNDLPSPETILAVVYETGSKSRALDEVLSDWEKRRRRILEDYKNRQSAHAIDVKAAEGATVKFSKLLVAGHPRPMSRSSCAQGLKWRNDARTHGLTVELAPKSVLEWYRIIINDPTAELPVMGTLSDQ